MQRKTCQLPIARKDKEPFLNAAKEKRHMSTREQEKEWVSSHENQ
jgi:hypothetical protein